MADTIIRQWAILQMIPRSPQKIDSATIEQKLEDHGYDVARRTIQRDLQLLSYLFPIICDEHKPYGWSWSRDAINVNIPGLSPGQALTFRMVESFLKPMLPQSTFTSLEPFFEQSRNILDSLSNNAMKKWPDKVIVIPRGQPLLWPEIDEELLEVLYTALLQEMQFEAKYRKRGMSEASDYLLNPLGIVLRNGIIYMLCTVGDEKDTKQFALHRFQQVKLKNTAAQIPDDFDLTDFVENQTLDFQVGEQSFQLKALFTHHAAYHLYESPLSEDQEITEINDDHVQVTATVKDTMELRWWLKGFGSQVEVLAPDSLRKEFVEEIKQMVGTYDV